MQYELCIPLLKAMAHPARLQILDMLRLGELCVCHIETALDKRQAYISQQLMVLREAGLVDSRKDGLQVYYWIADPRVETVLNALLDEPGTKQHKTLAGCPCPQCNEVSVETIR